MVRLIRLTSDTNDGRFINNFQSNIELSPFSQVAFKGCNIDVPEPQITIDGTNASIAYDTGIQFGGGGNIDHGVYNIKSNLEVLNAQIETGFNNMSNDRGTDLLQDRQIGQQWKADKGSNGTYQIQYNTANNTNLVTTEWQRVNLTVTDTDPTNLIFSRTSAAESNSDYAASKNPINKGGFRMLQRIQALKTSTDHTGTSVGISDIDFIGTSTAPTKDLLDIFIRTGDDTTTYFIKDGRLATATAVAGQTAALGDTFGIIKLGKKYCAVAYNSGGLEKFTQELTFQPSNWTNNYYGVIFIRDDAVDIDTVQYTPDPYSFKDTPPNNFFISSALYDIGIPDLELELADATISLGLSAFLGFNNRHLQNQESQSVEDAELGIKEVFTASVQLNQAALDDAYVIELMNLDLDSYDGNSGTRRAILETIDFKATVDDTVIIYQPAEYVYLDLNNKQPLNLRNISARIVTETFGNVATEGFNTLTIYVKDGPDSRDRAFIN